MVILMVILNRVRTYLEAQLLDAQQGFRQQRGTPDALFNHRVLWAVLMKQRSRCSGKGVSGLAPEVEEVGTKREEARSKTTRLSDTGLVPP